MTREEELKMYRDRLVGRAVVSLSDQMDKAEPDTFDIFAASEVLANTFELSLDESFEKLMAYRMVKDPLPR